MVQIVMRYIGVPEAMHRDRMGKTDDLATFSKSIGHSSIRTTMEIYAHLDMTQNRYIPRAMEDLKEF